IQHHTSKTDTIPYHTIPYDTTTPNLHIHLQSPPHPHPQPTSKMPAAKSEPEIIPAYTPSPDPDAMQKVQHVWDWYFSVAAAEKMKDIIDYRMMKDLTLIDARPYGRSVWKLKVPRYLCNLNLSLHGGGACVLLDMCTMSALAPLAGPKFWVFLGGLTRSMNLTYIRDCPVDTEVIIDSTVIQAGRTMALIRGEIKSLDGRVTYVTVDHGKVNVGPGKWMMEYEPEPRLGLEPCERIWDCGSKL
ncbi:hypothetical protein BZA77DRAFT_378503, partial [Pyronema omphalodes]